MQLESTTLSKNHHLYYNPTFRGLPLMAGYLPMITEMLDSLHGAISCSLEDYSRVFAFRFDLHLPTWIQAGTDAVSNVIVSRFIDSLKSKIRHNRTRAAEISGYAHDSRVRYFWVREVGEWGRVHYHCVVMLNRDAFNWLGRYQSTGDNMAVRIVSAWASALGLAVEQVRELVHFPESPSFMLSRDDPTSMAALFHRASYLCKAATKHFGYGHHGYSSSRG